MTTSLVLIIKSALTAPSSLLGATPHSSVRDIVNYLEGCLGGNQHASIDASSSTTSPVRAATTATLTYASIANNDTVTIGGTALTCVTGTPVGAQFKAVTDGPTTAANLAALINSNATTKLYCSAAAVGSVVTVKAHAAGTIGNFVTLATSNAAGFTLAAATLVGGAGGGATSTTYRLGL